MFIVAFIWVVFGGLAIAIGVEKEETWRKKLKVGMVVDHVRRILLIIGVIASSAAILASFYFFVFQNALIIFITWIVVFLFARFFIEILMLRTIADNLPPPIAETPQLPATENSKKVLNSEEIRKDEEGKK